MKPVGRFAVKRLLGEGGMGEVYEAHDPDLNRSVALKLLRPELAGTEPLRLMREAQALAQLGHPNVVNVYEVGTAEERLFIAMEFVDGDTLGQHLRAAARPWREVVGLFVQAGHGLAAAHARSIIHRDFKPANVLVDRHGRVRVGDFGLARVEGGEPPAAGAPAPRKGFAAATTVDEGVGPPPPLDPAATPRDGGLLAAPLTQVGAFLGTPRYMAPEQREGLPATARSDQFSFCVALWEALAGEHPFAPLDADRPRPFPRGRAPRWLVRVLEVGLAADPALRHASMAELVALLEETPARRRRIGLVAGALALSAVIIVVLAVQYRRAERAAREAHERLIESWLEQGRQALLDGDPHRSLSFLGKALRAGAAADDAVRFMIAKDLRSLKKRVATLRGHRDEVTFLAVSPDGRRVVSASADRTARLWDVDALASLAVVRHDAPLVHAAFDAAGERVVTVAEDGVALVWDGHDGRAVATLRDPGTLAATFAADGSLVTWTEDHFVVWTLPGGVERLRQEVAAAPFALAAAAHAPRLLVSSTVEDAVWDTGSWTLVGRHTHEAATPCRPAFDAPGRRYVSCAGPIATVSDLGGTGGVVTLAGHSRRIIGAHFSPDGTEVLTVGVDRRARVWDAASGRSLATIEGPEALMNSAELDPTGRSILTTSDDGTVRLWSAASGDLESGLITGGQAYRAHYLEGGRRVVVGGSDGAVTLWDASPDDVVAGLGGHSDSTLFAKILPDGSLFSSGEEGLAVFHAPDGSPVRSLRLREPQVGGMSRIVDVSGDRIATATEDGFALLDAATGRVVRAVTTAPISWIQFSGGGGTLATAGSDGVVRLWTRAGEAAGELAGHQGPVLFAAFDPAEARLVSTGSDGTAVIWDLAARRPAVVLRGHAHAVHAAAFSSDGARVATAGADRTAISWRSDGVRLATFEGHHGSVSAVAYVPGRDLLVTGSLDGDARVWAASTGRLLYRLPVHANVSWVAVSGDGARVVTAAASPRALILDLAGDVRGRAALLADPLID